VLLWDGSLVRDRGRVRRSVSSLRKHLVFAALLLFWSSWCEFDRLLLSKPGVRLKAPNIRIIQSPRIITVAQTPGDPTTANTGYLHRDLWDRVLAGPIGTIYACRRSLDRLVLVLPKHG
jgi:hypothetical protein